MAKHTIPLGRYLMTETALALNLSGIAFPFFIAVTFALGIFGYAFLSKSKIKSRIRKEPDLHLVADPLMDAPFCEPLVQTQGSPAMKEQKEQSDSYGQLEFQPYPKASALLAENGVVGQVVVESGFVSGPLYFSDLDASVQAEIFNLESKKRMLGNHWIPFLYQSEELPPSSKLIFIYAHPTGRQGPLSGYCFIG